MRQTNPQPLALKAIIPDNASAIAFRSGAGDHCRIVLDWYADNPELLRLRGARLMVPCLKDADLTTERQPHRSETGAHRYSRGGAQRTTPALAHTLAQLPVQEVWHSDQCGPLLPRDVLVFRLPRGVHPIGAELVSGQRSARQPAAKPPPDCGHH
jgi:hypothetical protein